MPTLQLQMRNLRLFLDKLPDMPFRKQQRSNSSLFLPDKILRQCHTQLPGVPLLLQIMHVINQMRQLQFRVDEAVHWYFNLLCMP